MMFVKVESFVQLSFGSQTVRKRFEDMMTRVADEMETNSIRFVEQSGAQLKNINRAFYKVFLFLCVHSHLRVPY